jgi:hypothetical protein
MVVLPEIYRELSAGRSVGDDFFPRYRRPDLPTPGKYPDLLTT